MIVALTYATISSNSVRMQTMNAEKPNISFLECSIQIWLSR